MLNFAQFHPQTERSTHVVSYWHLPGGYDAVNATVRYAFFDSEEEAQELVHHLGEDSPAMAVAMTVDDHRCELRQQKHRHFLMSQA